MIHAAIITGASSGIGLATAKQLSEAGWSLVLAGRTQDKLAETAAVCRDAIAIPCDMAEPEQVARLVPGALERFGRLDAVINNAGLATLLPIDEHTPDELDRIYRTNTIGPASLIASAWPVFVEQNAGCVVNVSTYGTRDPFPGFFGYASSKAAVELMVRSCANEGASHNIRAFAVAPGAVETPMLRGLFDENAIPSDRCLSPGDVARVIVECVAGARDSENGQTIYLPNP